MEIQNFTPERLEEIKSYYDHLPMGVCIQKYLETEDGLGDYIPVYANELFAESMGAPLFVVLANSLRSFSASFPPEKLQEMSKIAFHGLKISGNAFSYDYKRYFRTDMYQYEYGYIISFVTDITSAYATGKTLTNIGKTYEAIYYVQAKDDISFVVNSDQEMIPFTYEEFMRTYTEVKGVIPEEYDAFMEFTSKDYVKKALNSDKKLSRKFQIKNEQGKYEWRLFDLIADEIDMATGDVLSFTITVRDIDDLVRQERKRQEELEKAVKTAQYAYESKSNFLKHMSHDLRTPLNGIIGILQLMEDNISDREQMLSFIEDARGNAHTLLDIFRDILDLTRIDSEGLEAGDAVFDLRIVSPQLENVKQKMPVKIEIEKNEFKYPIRKAKDVYIRQVMLQLVENAVKFNKEDGRIRVSFKEMEDPTWVEFVVEDTGIGMTQEFINHIFEPFTQERDDARTKYQGSGLGLTYVKKLVDKMSGTIKVESEKGVGSSFIVCLPMEIVTDESVQISNVLFDTKLLDTNSLENKRVLLVEDNRVNMMVAKKLLEKNRMIVETAENGLLGLEKFEQSKPYEYDYILMDLMMPIMDGVSSARKIRNLDREDAKLIPILAVSANTLPEDITGALEAGMNEHISKPIDMNYLLLAMKKYETAFEKNG